MSNPQLAELGEKYRAGQPGITLIAPEKRKRWSMRRAIEAIADMEFDAGIDPTYENLRHRLAQRIQFDDGYNSYKRAEKPREGKVRGGMLLACRRFAKALEGDSISLQAIEDTIDGKLIDKTETTVNVNHTVSVTKLKDILLAMRAGMQADAAALPAPGEPVTIENVSSNPEHGIELDTQAIDNK